MTDLSRPSFRSRIGSNCEEEYRVEFHKGREVIGLLGDDEFIQKTRLFDENIERKKSPAEKLLKVVLEVEGVSETDNRSTRRIHKLALSRQ